ncbi:MAG: hypothetical protein NTZ67_06010, partial [Gammaproteobacteria bacterium]|nr:hypothetical protein [Gammaproteobacteria bacterium]
MIDNDTLERLINANREIHSVVNIVPDDQPNLQPTIELTYPQAAKALLQFAIPLLFRSGTFAAYESLKALIVSQDKTLLPAYADIRITEIVLQCFLSGIVYSIPPIIREAKHANETLKIGIIFRQGIIYSALAGMIISAGAVIIIPKMLEVADQPGVVTQNSQAYFAYSALGYFLEAIYRSEIRFIMGGFGIKKTALITDFFDVMLDLALTDAFMFGRFGFPEMRLPGAALAFTVSKLIALVVHTLFI